PTRPFSQGDQRDNLAVHLLPTAFSPAGLQSNRQAQSKINFQRCLKRAIFFDANRGIDSQPVYSEITLRQNMKPGIAGLTFILEVAETVVNSASGLLAHTECAD
ncbi:MAG: hypothetical protein DRQ02_11720, partial [Candidatus Latescibacterota bacterium]